MGTKPLSKRRSVPFDGTLASSHPLTKHQLKTDPLPLSSFFIPLTYTLYSSTPSNTIIQFVVDGNWITDHTAPQENDHSGNLNNFLTPDRINTTSLTSAIMSGVTPQATTSQLAGQVPKEGQSDGSIPGAFPETPAPEIDNQQKPFDAAPQQSYEAHQTPAQQEYAAIPQEAAEQTFGVNPLPATSGPGNPVIPNENDIVPPSSDFTFNTVQSTVHDDEELKAADLAKQSQQSTSHDQAYPVAPKPFTEEGPAQPVTLAPGEKFPSADEYALGQKNIHDKEELKAAELFREQQQQNVSVNPLPATAGAGNPITLAPGIPVPKTDEFTANTVNSNVKLDEASYNKPDAMVGGAPFLPPVVTPAAERANKGTGVFDVPPITKNMIPESSLPMGAQPGTYDAEVSPFVQSAAPTSTTAQLAGQVPLENKKPQAETVVVPSIVKESQAKAHFPPEASAQTEPVIEKHQVEDELLAKVPKAPVTADGTPSVGEVATAVGGAVTALAGAAAVYANTAKAKVVEAYQQAPSTEQVKESLPAPIKNVVAPPPAPTASHAAPGPVQASIAEAHASPEAAANREAIAEKQQVETELLQKVPTHNETGEPAPNVKPVAIHVDQHKLKDALVEAQNTIEKQPQVTGKGQSEHHEHGGVASAVPGAVKDSISEAHAEPEAAAYEEPIREKTAVEEELLRKVPTHNESGEHAPQITGQSESRETEIPASQYLAEQDKEDKRSQTSPVVTDGIQAIPVAATSSAPQTQTRQPTTAELPQENLNVSRMPEHSRDVSPMTRPGEHKSENTTRGSAPIGENKPRHLSEAVSSHEGTEPKHNADGEQTGHFHVEPLPPVRDAAPEHGAEKKETKDTKHIAGGSGSHDSATGAPATATSSNHTTESGKKEKRRSFFGKLKDKLKN